MHKLNFFERPWSRVATNGAIEIVTLITRGQSNMVKMPVEWRAPSIKRDSTSGWAIHSDCEFMRNVFRPPTVFVPIWKL